MTVLIDPTPPGLVRRRFVPPLLHQRPFRRFWTGHTISLVGDQVTLLAIPLLAVLTAHATPAQMGYLTAAGLVPYLLFSLIAGAWADRQPRKRVVMIVADLGRAGILVAVPILYAGGLLTLGVLYGVAFAVGTFSVLFGVCDRTLFAALVTKDDYVEANSLLNGSRAMSFVVGPSIGGILVQVLTAPFALIADAVSYLASAFMLARIAPDEPAPSTSTGWGISEGMRFLVRQPVLRALFAGATTLNLFNYMFSALFVLYASTSLGVRPGALGVVLGAGAIGAVIGAVVMRPLVARIGIGPAFVVGMVMFPAPLMLVPLARGGTVVVLAALFSAEFLSGAGVMLLDIAAGSLITAVTPDELRARTAGAQNTINYGIRPIGAVLGGFLGSTIGVHATLWVGAIGGVLGVLWLIASPIPAMREL